MNALDCIGGVSCGITVDYMGIYVTSMVLSPTSTHSISISRHVSWRREIAMFFGGIEYLLYAQAPAKKPLSYPSSDS